MIGISIVALVIGLVFMIFGLRCTNVAEDRINAKEKSFLRSVSRICAFIAAICIASTAILPVVLPKYEVWRQYKAGEAELARAEQNRKIAIEEAKAKEEAAASLANAEIIRARGIAQANQIIGDSLQNNDAYIHYLWIEALRESTSDVIYIPTEAGIPITESSRFFRKNDRKVDDYESYED